MSAGLSFEHLSENRRGCAVNRESARSVCSDEYGKLLEDIMFMATQFIFSSDYLWIIFY